MGTEQNTGQKLYFAPSPNTVFPNKLIKQICLQVKPLIFLMLVLLNLVLLYLIFALQLVKVRFIQVVRVWWPLVALVFISVLVSMFFYQIKIRKKIWKNFPDIVEEPDDFSEEGDAE